MYVNIIDVYILRNLYIYFILNLNNVYMVIMMYIFNVFFLYSKSICNCKWFFFLNIVCVKKNV